MLRQDKVQIFSPHFSVNDKPQDRFHQSKIVRLFYHSLSYCVVLVRLHFSTETYLVTSNQILSYIDHSKKRGTETAPLGHHFKKRLPFAKGELMIQKSTHYSL